MHVIIGEQIGWHLSMLAESLRRRHFVYAEIARERLREKYAASRPLKWKSHPAEVASASKMVFVK